MYSAQAGKRMAEQIAGRKVKPELPIFASPSPVTPSRPSAGSGKGCSTNIIF